MKSRRGVTDATRRADRARPHRRKPPPPRVEGAQDDATDRITDRSPDMKRIVTALLAMAALAGTGTVAAQERMTREQWQQLSPEQREAARAQARERFQSMSPEEQAAAKQRMRERYETLSPEQQAQVRQRMQERRAARPQ
jgi:hypothetical protein